MRVPKPSPLDLYKFDNSKVMALKHKLIGFMVYGLRFRVEGLELRVRGFESRV